MVIMLINANTCSLSRLTGGRIRVRRLLSMRLRNAADLRIVLSSVEQFHFVLLQWNNGVGLYFKIFSKICN